MSSRPLSAYTLVELGTVAADAKLCSLPTTPLLSWFVALVHMLFWHMS